MKIPGLPQPHIGLEAGVDLRVERDKVILGMGAAAVEAVITGRPIYGTIANAIQPHGLGVLWNL